MMKSFNYLPLSMCLSFYANAALAQNVENSAETMGGRLAFADEEPKLLNEEGETLPVNSPILAGDRIEAQRGYVHLEFLGQRQVYLSSQSRLLLTQLEPMEIDFEQGTIRIDAGPKEPIVVRGGFGEVSIEPGSDARIEYFGDQAQLIALSGPLRASIGGQNLQLEGGEAIRIVGDGDVRRYRYSGGDAFDRFAIGRGAREGSDFQQKYVEDAEEDYDEPDEQVVVEHHHHYQEPLGYSELNGNGAWVVVDGASFWRPQVVSSWRPFFDGRWVWRTRLGWTWVSSSPWEYVTSHYGRWRFSTNHGWIWSPGRRWSPGWVYWNDFGTHVGWSPVTFFGGPVGVQINYGNRNLGCWSIIESNYFRRTQRRFAVTQRRVIRRLADVRGVNTVYRPLQQRRFAHVSRANASVPHRRVKYRKLQPRVSQRTFGANAQPRRRPLPQKLEPSQKRSIQRVRIPPAVKDSARGRTQPAGQARSTRVLTSKPRQPPSKVLRPRYTTPQTLKPRTMTKPRSSVNRPDMRPATQAPRKYYPQVKTPRPATPRPGVVKAKRRYSSPSQRPTPSSKRFRVTPNRTSSKSKKSSVYKPTKARRSSRPSKSVSRKSASPSRSSRRR